MLRAGWLATSRQFVLVVVGAAVASLGLQLLFPLGHKPIKDLVLGVFLLGLGSPLMVFSPERLRQGRPLRERLRVEDALRRRRRDRAQDEWR